MTIKKKLIVSTIAASVAATAFAGLPLSNKGLAEKLGFNTTAYAAATSSKDTLLAQANALHAELAKGDGSSLTKVKALRTAIQNVPDTTLKAIAQPITNKIKTKLGTDWDTHKDAFISLISAVMGFTYDPDLSYLETLSENTEYRAALSSLAAGAGITDLGSLTVEDVATYLLSLQEQTLALINGMNATQLIAVWDNTGTAREDLVKNALAAMPTTGLKVKQVLDAYLIAPSDVAGLVSGVQAELNPTTVKNAILALYAAYVAISDVDNGGNEEGGGGGGGAVIGGGEETTVKVPEEVTGLIDDIKGKLANATDAEKAAIVAEAIQQATALVNKLSTVDLSSTVTVSNGQAKLQVSGSSVLSAIAGIGEILKSVKELAPGAAVPPVVLNISLGNIAQNDVNIGLNDAVIQEAIKAGLGGINLTVNGLSATLPVGGQFNGAVDFNINKSQPDAETTGDLQAASDVYSFELSIGGQGVTAFTQPVIVGIPLGNLDGIDEELLSLAKIIEGKLAFQGGAVQGNTIVEHRDTFSQYVVVENKVTFTDIASVEAWAGREIQVIAAKGAIEGKKAGVFAPKDNVTRAEFAKMLTRALDIDNSSAKENFTDVKDTDWSAPYIGAAAALGIIQGRSATKFDPNAQITRAEMATMIARALKVTKSAQDVTDLDAALANFKDAGSISAALKAGVAFASKNGIVVGNNGKFSPNASATRAEAAVMIYRAVNFK